VARVCRRSSNRDVPLSPVIPSEADRLFSWILMSLMDLFPLRESCHKPMTTWKEAQLHQGAGALVYASSTRSPILSASLRGCYRSYADQDEIASCWIK
jgi:hypothetical protein